MKKTFFLTVFLLAIALLTTSTTLADPVIDAAIEVAAPLPDEQKIRANVAILIAKQQLGEGGDAEAARLFDEAMEIAKRDHDFRRRSEKLAQIVPCIVPEDAHSFDVILDEDTGYTVTEAILKHCRAANRSDLAYLLFGEILSRQPDEKAAGNMRFFIDRVYLRQDVKEALAQAGRLKNPELRRFAITDIRKDYRRRIQSLLTSGEQSEASRAAAQKLLAAYYPDLDTSDWGKCVAEATVRMSEEITTITDPVVRFESYGHLIEAYRKIHALPTPATAPDPALRRLIAAAVKTADQLKDDVIRDSRRECLAKACRWALENADSEMANIIVDHMITILPTAENLRPRELTVSANAILDVISLLYKLDRTDDADRWCDEILQDIDLLAPYDVRFESVVAAMALESDDTWRVREGKKFIRDLAEKGPYSYFRGVSEVYTRRVSQLLELLQYEAALEFIDEAPIMLGERIQLMQQVAEAYDEAGDTANSDATYQAMFARVDELAELVAAENDRGARERVGDIWGRWGTSLTRAYSHPIVKLWRQRGDLAGAADLARKLYATHSSAEIISIARRYADAGEYDRAMEAGGAMAGSVGSDAAIRGYVAQAMLKHGDKVAAEKLLADTLAEIDAGKMPPSGDFIVGLVLCGRVDDAVRLSKISARDETKDRYGRQPTVILRCLLTAGHEAEAMLLVDDWPDAAGKAWGIWTLVRWNREMYLDRGMEPIITPEWKQRWTEFLGNYADTLDETDAAIQIGEWNRAADCLIHLGSPENAAKVLDKALEAYSQMDVKPPQYGNEALRVHTGKLLVKLGEREKAQTAFTLAVETCHALEKDYRKLDSLKHILSEYTAALLEKSPEYLQIWPGYGTEYDSGYPADYRRKPSTLKYLWTRGTLFSSYPVM